MRTKTHFNAGNGGRDRRAPHARKGPKGKKAERKGRAGRRQRTEPLIEQPLSDTSGTVLCRICGHPVDPQRMHPHMVRFHGVAIRAQRRVGADNPIQPRAREASHGRERAAESGLLLEPGGAQVVFELAKVFGQFRGPAHARAWLVGMFEGEDFCVQGLAREINARAGGVRSAHVPGCKCGRRARGVRRSQLGRGFDVSGRFPAGAAIW